MASVLNFLFFFLNGLIGRIPYFKFLRETGDYQCSINIGMWIKQKVFNLGGNNRAYWPVHPTSKVLNPENILVGIDAYPGYMGGNYIQGMGKIIIGDYTQIAPNVCIISGNHDLYDTRIHILKEVKIGAYCWIGANATVLPGVVLGDFTVVAAGAVVTKSFTDGHCVLGGNPARVIKNLDIDKCIRFQNKVKYHGFIPASKFEKFKLDNLNLNN